MFLILSSGFKGKAKFLVILSVFILTAVAAVVISLCSSVSSEANADYVLDLNETGGTGGFLSQFSLEYESQESSRAITLPSEDDELFKDYADFQSELGLNLLKFSGKRVEEKYLRLKNKSENGENLYAVLYIYKEKVIAAHLTDLLEGSELMPITAFV